MNKQSIKARALEFQIWRVAQANDWDCTVTDIAREIGKPQQTVWQACERRGWIEKLAKGCDEEIRSRASRHANAKQRRDFTGAEVDLCDIFKANK